MNKSQQVDLIHIDSCGLVNVTILNHERFVSVNKLIHFYFCYNFPNEIDGLF